MPRISEVREHLSRLARKQEKQRKRFRRSKPGSRARASAKRALARLRSPIREATELLKRLQVVIDWNGHEPIPRRHRKQRKAVRWVLRKVPGLYVSSTYRPDSVTYHGPGLGPWAVDFGSDDPSNAPERKAQALLLDKYGAADFLELFGPDNTRFVKNGSRYTAPEGEYLEDLHDDHTHMVRKD